MSSWHTIGSYTVHGFSCFNQHERSPIPEDACVSCGQVKQCFNLFPLESTQLPHPAVCRQCKYGDPDLVRQDEDDD